MTDVRSSSEQFLPEDAALAGARARAREAGLATVSPGTGAALRFLAAAAGARTVVEIGTGTGVSGIWLLRGMRPDGVLTTIDPEAENQRLAREAFAEAGLTAPRVRLIVGRAATVLPRLADGGYDLVHVDSPPRDGDYLGELVRLLRTGGVVVFSGGGPDRGDDDAEAFTALAEAVREDPRLIPVLLPLGTGLLAAVVGPPEA